MHVLWSAAAAVQGIEGFNGRVRLTWTSLYFACVWIVAGMVCTLFTKRRGLYVAIVMPILVSVLPAIFFVSSGGVNPVIQFFRFGDQIGDYWDIAIIPFFASLVGGLLGELINPSEEE